MLQENIEHANNLISGSEILTPAERQEWLDLLPEMSEMQIAELVNILTPQSTAPRAQTAPAKPAQAYRPPEVNIKEKELPAGHPFYEPELTGDVAAPSLDQLLNKFQPQQPPKPRPQPAAAKPQQTAPQPQPVPRAPQPEYVPEVIFQKPTRPTPPPQKIELKKPEDFLRLTPGIIRGSSSPAKALQKLYQAVLAVSSKNRFFQVLHNLEQSPLYSVYVQMGLGLLNDSDPDRDSVYESLIQDAVDHSRDYMTKEEFEAFTDFRKQLDSINMV